MSTLPKTAGIPEELSPKSVLKRQENDVPLIKSNGCGYRSSSRSSFSSPAEPEAVPKTSSSSAVSEVDVTPGSINGGVTDADTYYEMETDEQETQENQTPLNLNKNSKKVASSFYGLDSVTSVTPQVPVTPASQATVAVTPKKTAAPKKVVETPKSTPSKSTPKKAPKKAEAIVKSETP